MGRGLPDSLAGVGLTAIGVALIRARESERVDRLFDDPYARLFADSAEQAFSDLGAPAGAAATWARMQHLVDDFYDDRALSSKFFDDYLLEACQAGCAQVVIVGAGLDTRALRLPLPTHTETFEIDLPAMFDFKEKVLSGAAALHPGRRHTVATDLRGDWELDLRAQGFRDDLPTAWLEEGVLPYLPDDDARSVLSTITSLSPARSRLAQVAQLATTATASTSKRYQTLKEFVGSDNSPDDGPAERTRPQLDGDSWQMKIHSQVDLQRLYGRITPDADGTQYVVAVRR
jgi:methyltransferase (TIGR00027 family)